MLEGYISREAALKAANEWVNEACMAPVMRVSRTQGAACRKAETPASTQNSHRISANGAAGIRRSRRGARRCRSKRARTACCTRISAPRNRQSAREPYFFWTYAAAALP